MSTHANLPAGSLTTVAGETLFANTTREAAVQSTTPIAPPPESTTSSAEVQGNSSLDTASSISTSSAAPTTSIVSTSSSTPEPETTTSSIPPPAATITSVTPVESITPAAASSTSKPPTSASPISTTTTPTVSSITATPILQSEVSATPSSTEIGTIENNGFTSVVPSSRSSTSITSTTTSGPVAESSAAIGIASNSEVTAAPVVGGVLGSVAFLGIIGLLLWFLRRRKRKVSLLTPLTTGTKERFYEIDSGSVGPTRRSTKWKATLEYQSEKLRDQVAVVVAGAVGVGASLKTKLAGDRSDTPSVDLDRGNSQFLDGPIPQHSRNNSSVLSSHTGNVTVQDRFDDWWQRFTDGMNFNWRLRQRDRQSMDLFASARSMSEQQANINRPPDFSQLLGMDDRELHLQAERRRASFGHSPPQIGSLGLDFSTQQDPFADPPSKAPGHVQNPAMKLPSTSPGSNPFADPINPPTRSIPKQNSYISDIRRLRGLSIDTTKSNHFSNPPPTINTNPNIPPTTTNNKTTSLFPTSRYPSSIAPSRDSYRDTLSSSISTNARKGKGRSDPFDLERPELWRPKFDDSMPTPRDSTRDLYPDPLRTPGRHSIEDRKGPLVGIQPRIVSTMNDTRNGRVVSETGTYANTVMGKEGVETKAIRMEMGGTSGNTESNQNLYKIYS
ncbi:hypothetical protein D0Z07_6965 [Hyphodiscus hymeniophilus]|uniref:Uncharacterized protein n=1 Tax=Hyphodiscus hymeniophilus TaxID=353542 RepID=A0A9P7AVG7_9HELO|nr:hypothetical protein D0Z07_6965 [Hyphodiscus hymeniophilus]